MTKRVKNKFLISLGVFILLLVLDQWSKFYVKTHFVLGESVEVFDWFYIRFIENNGMDIATNATRGIVPFPVFTFIKKLLFS